MRTDSQRGPLTPRDRELVRASLSELARVSQTSILAALGAPSESSVAALCINSSSNLESKYGPRLFKSACDSIALSVTAAADNIDSFVSSLKVERATVSMAALTRAAVEAYGRAYFLLRAQTDLEFFHRYLSLTHEELKFPEKHSGLTDAEGVEIDGPAYRAELVELATKLGIEKLLNIGLGSLVSDVLDQMVEGPVDLAIYSQLSGVAHGTTSAVGMFIETSPTGWKLIFPRDIALEYTGYLYVSAVTVTDRAIEMFEPPALIRDRWQAARDRSSVALSELRNSEASDD